MCTASLLALGALYPHPATAHSMAAGMRAALLVPLGARATKLSKVHKSLTSYRLPYTRRPPRSQIQQAATQSARGLPLAR